jgi:hypothetical protein
VQKHKSKKNRGRKISACYFIELVVGHAFVIQPIDEQMRNLKVASDFLFGYADRNFADSFEVEILYC